LTTFLLSLSLAAAHAQPAPAYDTLIQQGKTQLQAGNSAQALATGQQAIQLDTNRWEAYALAGGALMNLKRYEEAADNLSLAIQHAPEAKQDGLRALRKQCALAESGAVPAPAQPAPPPQPATTTQAEIVLWKSIENSDNPADFQTYLSQYPLGAFNALAQRHLEESQKRLDQQRAQTEHERKERAEFVGTIWMGQQVYFKDNGTQIKGAHLTILLLFTSLTEYLWGTPYKHLESIESDATSLSSQEFARKYNLNHRGTWHVERPAITLTFNTDKDWQCGFGYTGTNAVDSMQGTWTAPGTKGFFGCADLHGAWDLHRIGSPAGNSAHLTWKDRNDQHVRLEE
jgi:tetratricopeptide (TPR) repeat protein